MNLTDFVVCDIFVTGTYYRFSNSVTLTRHALVDTFLYLNQIIKYNFCI